MITLRAFTLITLQMFPWILPFDGFIRNTNSFSDQPGSSLFSDQANWQSRIKECPGSLIRHPHHHHHHNRHHGHGHHQHHQGGHPVINVRGYNLCLQKREFLGDDLPNYRALANRNPSLSSRPAHHSNCLTKDTKTIIHKHGFSLQTWQSLSPDKPLDWVDWVLYLCFMKNLLIFKNLNWVI